MWSGSCVASASARCGASCEREAGYFPPGDQREGARTADGIAVASAFFICVAYPDRGLLHGGRMRYGDS